MYIELKPTRNLETAIGLTWTNFPNYLTKIKLQVNVLRSKHERAVEPKTRKNKRDSPACSAIDLFLFLLKL